MAEGNARGKKNPKFPSVPHHDVDQHITTAKIEKEIHTNSTIS
jgi:hypothetical protein